MKALKGRIVDVLNEESIEEGIVLIEDGKISDYGKDIPIPENCAIYEIEDGTILPGFIDAHAHLTGEEDAGEFADGRLFGDRLLGAAYQLSILLNAGFTGIRDMSQAGLYLSRAVERGVLKGPKIMPGGKLLGITSGHLDGDPRLSKEEYNRLDQDSRLVDGVDDCIRGVREQFRAGAKFIKICATGGVSSPTDRIDDVQFSGDELKAIVEETKRHHSYVCAHCTGNEGAYQALNAGIRCIEHGVFLSQREIDLMKELDATLVSTLYISLGVKDFPGLPPYLIRKAQDCAAANTKTIEMALKAGIRIAFGSDFSNSKNTPYEHLGWEFEAMTRAGMSPMQAIKAGTINAAYLLGEEANTGSITKGKWADLVIVKGDPLKDIRLLGESENIPYVFLNGDCVKSM